MLNGGSDSSLRLVLQQSLRRNTHAIRHLGGREKRPAPLRNEQHRRDGRESLDNGQIVGPRRAVTLTDTSFELVETLDQQAGGAVERERNDDSNM